MKFNSRILAGKLGRKYKCKDCDIDYEKTDVRWFDNYAPVKGPLCTNCKEARERSPEIPGAPASKLSFPETFWTDLQQCLVASLQHSPGAHIMANSKYTAEDFANIKALIENEADPIRRDALEWIHIMWQTGATTAAALSSWRDANAIKARQAAPGNATTPDEDFDFTKED